MKKFLVMATVVGAAFTSCVDDNEAVWQQEESSARPITFEVAKYKPASRAEGEPAQQADDGIVKFETDKTFGTFAYMTKNGVNGHTIYMDNVQVDYYENGSYWAPVRKTTTNDDGETVEQYYVWPNDGHLDFISYYPYTETVVGSDGTKTYPSTIPQISDSDGQKKISYSYDIESEGAPHDLMYSDKAVFQTANEDHYGFSGVPTLFHHALAKLNFAVKATKLDNNLTAISDAFKYSWEVTVKSISLKSIYKAGTVTMETEAVTTTVPTTTQWKNAILNNDVTTSYNVWTVNTSTQDSRDPFMQSKTWTHSQILSIEPRIYNGSAEVVTDRAENYFIIPQTLSSQEITINYKIVTKDKDGNVTDTKDDLSVTKSFSSISTIPAWEMGKSITYIIDIDPEGDVIHFAPAVVDWESQNGTISI